MNAFELPLHFLRPWWWLALLPLPLAVWMAWRSGSGRAALARLVDASLLPYVAPAGARRRTHGLALLALAWLLCVAALSGPAWQRTEAPLYVNGAARVVVLSLSNDMLAADVKPDRMTRARFAVHDLIEHAGDARTALVAYAGAAFTVAPLTDDKRTVLNLLQALRPDVMPVPGNDAGAGIDRAVRLLDDGHVAGGEIVLVTDAADAAATSAARKARAHGVRVDVLGVGTTAGAPIPRRGGGFQHGVGGMDLARRDDAALRAVAAAGGGSYVVLHGDPGAGAAFAVPVARGSDSATRRAQLWRDGGVWLLPLLVVLAALAFRRGWLLVLAVCLLPATMQAAHASTWESLWHNRDQRAVTAMQRGDAAQARTLATTPPLRGAAAYRDRDYAAAAKDFSRGGDARAHYNLGNALAKQGQYPQAIAAWRKAVQQDPRLADAKANIQSVEAWLKKQQPPAQGGSQHSGKQRAPHNKGQHDASGGGTSRSSGSQGAQGGNPSQGQPAASSSAGTGAPQPSAQAGSKSDHDGAAQARSGSKQGDAGQPQASNAHGAAQAESSAEASAAQQGLARSLRDAGKTRQGQPFRLGQQADAPEPSGDKLDATQRALLQSLPDDPGALLRRKFQLEWQQRQHADDQGGGQ